MFPIYQGTVFSVQPGEAYHDIKYIRLNTTPSQVYLHDKLAALEGAEAAMATSSGMAAVTATLLTVLRRRPPAGRGHPLRRHHDFLTQYAEDARLDVHVRRPARAGDVGGGPPAEHQAFLVETITNPLMRVARLREVAAFARRTAWSASWTTPSPAR